MIRGPLHFAAEANWLRTRRPGLADPTFFGGYAEVGYFLTKGDSRGYKAGIFDRVKPSQSVA
jgi:phosphate-selective porin OprO/OprP